MRLLAQVRTLLTVVLVAAATMLIGGRTAGADTVPFTDPQAVGRITLCDVAGQVMTHGDTRTKPFVWRAVGSAAPPAQLAGFGRTAALYGYQPINGLNPDQWNGDQLTTAAAYTSRNRPMAAATAADGSLADLLANYPTKWNGLFELRMFLDAPGRATLTNSYSTATLRVTGHSWTLLDGGHSGCHTGTARSGEMILPSVRKLPPPKESVYAAAERLAARSAGGNASGTNNGGGDARAGDASAVGDQVGAAHDAAASSSNGSSATGWVIGVVLLLAASGGFVWWRFRRAGQAP